MPSTRTPAPSSRGPPGSASACSRITSPEWQGRETSPPAPLPAGEGSNGCDVGRAADNTNGVTDHGHTFYHPDRLRGDAALVSGRGPGRALGPRLRGGVRLQRSQGEFRGDSLGPPGLPARVPGAGGAG